MKTETKILHTLAFLSFIVLGLFSYVAIYSYPQVDDYWYIDRALNSGVWESIVSEYLTWTGRYTATLLLSVSPLGWGTVSHYRLIPFILIALSFLAYLSFFKVIFKRSLSETLSIALIFTCIFIAGQPAITQTIYWWAGSSTYTVPTIFTTLLLAVYFSQLSKFFRLPLLLALSMLIIGSNETSMILMVYASACLLFMDFITSKKFKKEHILLFIWCLIWGVVVLKAPGNSVRAHQFEKSHQVFRTIGNSFVYSFVYPIKFLSVAMICSLPLILPYWKDHAWIKYLSQNKKWILLLVFGFFFMTFAPSLWGMGRRPNSRTMTVIFHGYIFVLSPLVALFIKGNWLKKIPLWILPIGFIYSINFQNIVTDFAFNKFEYFDERWTQIIETKAAEQMPFDESKRSMTLYFNDVEPIRPTFQKFLEVRPEFFK